jgi:hypothetical protein
VILPKRAAVPTIRFTIKSLRSAGEAPHSVAKRSAVAHRSSKATIARSATSLLRAYAVSGRTSPSSVSSGWCASP